MDAIINIKSVHNEQKTNLVNLVRGHLMMSQPKEGGGQGICDDSMESLALENRESVRGGQQ